MTVWDAISHALPASPAETETAEDLILEWESHGLVKASQTQMLSLSDNAIAWFFHSLGKTRLTPSPVSATHNSAWMAETDFCFVNVRATGLSEAPGSFIQAAKLLPTVSADAIHLAPFTRYQFDVAFAIESAKSISLNVLDHALLRKGISAWDQVRAFNEACHLLGKVVGFSLEPYFSQFGRPVIEFPQYFRWIKLDESKDFLIDFMHADEMYERDIQTLIIREVEGIRDGAFARFGVATFEYSESDYETDGIVPSATGARKDSAYRSCIRTLIQTGIWPLLTHTQDGVGLPEFAHYNHGGNYPEFQFLDENGDNKNRFSTGILTPIAFADGLSANRLPDEDFPPIPKHDSIAFYSGIFAFWRDSFGFDFARYESVDQVFLSSLDANGKIPVSDRPTPEIITKAIKESKKKSNAHIGAVADHQGDDIERFASLGFDVVLGDDMVKRIDRPHIEAMFEITDRLSLFNKSRASPCSIAFAVDTQDSGNPMLWGSPLIQCMGFERMRLRHFVSRFCSCGKAFRPKYEVMGFQDLSYGLYESQISEKNLHWKNNGDFSESYFQIESAWKLYRASIASSIPGPRFVRDGLAWWSFILESKNELLVFLASLETAEGSDQNEIKIDISSILPGKLHCTEYSFNAEPKKWFFEKSIVYSRLEYLGFRMFYIESKPEK